MVETGKLFEHIIDVRFFFFVATTPQDSKATLFLSRTLPITFPILFKEKLNRRPDLSVVDQVQLIFLRPFVRSPFFLYRIEHSDPFLLNITTIKIMLGGNFLHLHFFHQICYPPFAEPRPVKINVFRLYFFYPSI